MMWAYGIGLALSLLVVVHAFSVPNDVWIKAEQSRATSVAVLGLLAVIPILNFAGVLYYGANIQPKLAAAQRELPTRGDIIESDSQQKDFPVPPMVEQKKRPIPPLTWLLLGLALLALLVLGPAIGNVFDSDEPAASTAPNREAPEAPAREEKLIHKFGESTEHTTRPFSVPDRWEIRWTMGGDSNNIVHLHTAEGEREDLVVNTIGPTQGTKFYPKGGSFYLDIRTDVPWVIEVWQLA